MKIDRAIKILEELTKPYYHIYTEERKDAIRLGMEALKAVKFTREHPPLGKIAILDGEDSV